MSPLLKKRNEENNSGILNVSKNELQVPLIINMKSTKIKKESGHGKWVIKITIAAFFLSIFMSFFADLLLSSVSILFSFILLIVIILIGVIFDLIGVAVTVADEKPFHSMAAAKVKSAKSALKLIKNASKTSNIFNDVVGDICGIISGASAAFIVINVATTNPNINLSLLSVIISGVVASLTIGGKAIGKEIALNYSKEIMIFTGNIMSIFSKNS